MIKRSQAVEIFPQNFVRQSSARNINLDFSLEQLRWLPLKWLFPPYLLSVFYPYPQSLRTVGVRSYAHVIIKFSQTHRFPIFYSYGAPLLVRGRSAICPSLDKNSSSRLPSLFLSSLESFSVLSLRAKLGERVALWFSLTLPPLKWLTKQKNPKSLRSLQNAQLDTTPSTDFKVVCYFCHGNVDFTENYIWTPLLTERFFRLLDVGVPGKDSAWTRLG